MHTLCECSTVHILPIHIHMLCGRMHACRHAPRFHPSCLCVGTAAWQHAWPPQKPAKVLPRSCLQIRNMVLAYAQAPVATSPADLRQLLDRYNQHTRHCRHCRARHAALTAVLQAADALRSALMAGLSVALAAVGCLATAQATAAPGVASAATTATATAAAVHAAGNGLPGWLGVLAGAASGPAGAAALAAGAGLLLLAAACAGLRAWRERYEFTDYVHAHRN